MGYTVYQIPRPRPDDTMFWKKLTLHIKRQVKKKATHLFNFYTTGKFHDFPAGLYGNTTWGVCFRETDKSIITEHQKLNEKMHITSMFVSLQKNKVGMRLRQTESRVARVQRDTRWESQCETQKNTKKVYNNRWYYSHKLVYEDWILRFCCSVEWTMYCRNSWIYKNIQSLFKFLNVCWYTIGFQNIWCR